MTIQIEINAIANDRHRATVTVGETQSTLASTYSEADALEDALRYIDHEYKRGDYSKFALFHRGEESSKLNEV